jgi:hypothetical protein
MRLPAQGFPRSGQLWGKNREKVVQVVASPEWVAKKWGRIFEDPTKLLEPSGFPTAHPAPAEAVLVDRCGAEPDNEASHLTLA